MEAIATIKYVHISPKKIREVAHVFVGTKTDKAMGQLTFMAGKAPFVLLKAIKSAHANAINGMKMDANKLVIKSIEINKGPFLKRWNPVSRGMAHAIKKRMTHIKVVISEKEDKNNIAKDVKEVLKALPAKTQDTPKVEEKQIKTDIKVKGSKK